MRLSHRVTALLALLFLWCAPAFAQVPMTGAGKGTPAAAGRTCVDDTASTNFLARTSGLNNTEKDAACTLIKALETAGVITGTLSGANGCGTGSGVLDVLYVPATNNTTTAALNWCGTNFSLVTNGSLTFTADVGYTGNGSTGYLDTQYNPSTNAINLTLTSAAEGAYIQSTSASSSSAVIMGGNTTGGTNFFYMVPVQTGSFFWDINGNTFPSFANTNPQGAWVASRNSSSTVTSVYLNGATTSASGATDATGTVVNASLFLFARSDAGSPLNFANYQASAFFIAGGMTSTQAFATNNAINAYMTSLGHNIY
jgi:hypothetical protein